MYKVIGTVVLVVILLALLIAIFTGCFKSEEQPTITDNTTVTNNTTRESGEIIIEEPIYKEFDYYFDNSYAFSSIYEMTGLTSNDVIPNEEVIKTYDLGDLEGVTSEVRKNNDYEVAVIKLNNTDQSTQLLKKVSARIQKLNVTEDEVAIEQNKGVLTLVIGKRASAVSEQFTKQFSEI